MRVRLIVLFCFVWTANGCDWNYLLWNKKNDLLDLRRLSTAIKAESRFNEALVGEYDPPVRASLVRTAIRLYEYISNGSSIARFSNVGNAYFLDNRLPEAILAYRRGLELDPNDSSLRESLDYVRAQVQYPFDSRGRPESDSWPDWLYQPSSFQVLVVALAFYFLTCVFVTRWFMTRRRASLVRVALLLLIASAFGALWVYLEKERDERLAHPMIVVHDDKVPLRKGNGPSYPVHPDMPLLARGMEARKMHERGDWLQIQFASGERGWVEKKSVLVDEP
jgi:hypothetical protein